MELPGRLIVLAGPTAVGKGTVANRLLERCSKLSVSVSATTRAPRPGEVDGKTYFFVSDEQFDQMIAHQDFLEWAKVHNSNRYGTPKQAVFESLKAGKDVLLEIDIQGALQVEQSFPEAVSIFLLPPSWEELVHRLLDRGTETEEEQRQRLETAKNELLAVSHFDYQVINDDLELAVSTIIELLALE